MKVLLVKVPSSTHVVLPPLSLAYLSSVIKNKAEVRILDCLKQKYSYKEFKSYVEKYKPDIVGFTAFTMEINSAMKCAEIVKSVNKNMLTVIGGPHASTFPESILKNNSVDFIFMGEAEAGFPKLIEELKKNKPNFKKVPGLGYREIENRKEEIKLNKIKLIEDLDNLPFPDFGLMGFRDYPKLYLARKHPSAPILTSRGCPYQCTFCSAHKISGRKFRARSPENIIEEIKFLKRKYRIKEIQIWDDNFTLNKERVIRFCDLLIKENLNIIWWCPNGVRLETLDYFLLKKMKQAGCYAIVLGIESGSEKIQKDMKKNLNFNKLKEIVNFSHKLKIRTQGFFIIGYPTETKSDILKTIELSKYLPLDRATFGLFQPLPGSEIYFQLIKEGKIKNMDFLKIEYSKPSVVLPKGIKSYKELKKLQRKALIEFYSRPKIFLKFLYENFSITQVKEILLMFKKYILNK